MTRTRSSAKAAGTRFESLVAAYLARHVDDRIERRRLGGIGDRGDIAGLRHMGARIVVECKDYSGRLQPADWTRQADIERGNDDAVAGLVIAKRRGTTRPEDQWVICTLGDLVAILNGNRDHIDNEEA